MSKREIKINKILLAFDNSDISMVASEATLKLARTLGSEVVGLHAYNASMHDGAFHIMEPTLPSRYQKEEILQKQREVHNTLINVGMEKISLSYLSPIEETFRAANINFKAMVKEGKNFRSLIELAHEEGGDLMVMGAWGFSENAPGFIGSVCLRALHHLDMDMLIVKGPVNFKGGKFIIGLDGSPSSLRALGMAAILAEEYSAELHLIYVFDSKLHKDVFSKLKDSVINSGGRFSFNSKEQQKIHDLFIDRGLMKVGDMIIARAAQEVLDGNNGYTKKVFEGLPFREICDYASKVSADLIFAGKTGRHFVEGMDLGSVAENVVRFSPCSVFVTRHEVYRGWVL